MRVPGAGAPSDRLVHPLGRSPLVGVVANGLQAEHDVIDHPCRVRHGRPRHPSRPSRTAAQRLLRAGPISAPGVPPPSRAGHVVKHSATGRRCADFAGRGPGGRPRSHARRAGVSPCSACPSSECCINIQISPVRLNTPPDMSAVHCCPLCGATSYRPVLVRDAGSMKASGQYRCSGCNFVFDSLASWRKAGQGRVVPAILPRRPAPLAGALPVSLRRLPSFGGFGPSPAGQSDD